MSPEEPRSARADARPAGESLRASILETARSLLIAEGYNNLSMRKIARAVGCSATSIYLHFESKDALVHSLIDQGMESLGARLSEAAETPAPPLERLDALCRAYVDFGLENPEYYEAMFTLHAEHMARYPAEKYRRARRNLRLFAETLLEADAAGHARVGDAEVEASVLWATLHGAVTLVIARRIDARIDYRRFTDAVLERAITALTAPATDHA